MPLTSLLRLVNALVERAIRSHHGRSAYRIAG